MNRKSLGKSSLITAASAVLVAVVLNSTVIQTHLAAQCTMSQDVEGQPLQADPLACSQQIIENVNWFDWVGGKSRSYQFHFLDLLELLYSDDNDDSDGFNSPTSAL